MFKKKVDTMPIERFEPSIKYGLDHFQVKSRIENNLVNNVDKKYSKSYFSIFFGNIFTFFNLLGLLVAIALIYVGAPWTDFFFCLIFLCNILIGIIQEIRAKKTVDKLTLTVYKSIKVLRFGVEKQISSKEIVLDDLLLLELGDQIPSDCKVLKGEVEVNESLLTGESVPVKKKIGDTLFAGSFITSGHCKARVDKIGKDNYIETLSSKAKKYKKPYSELMYSLKFIIMIIAIFIVPIAAGYVVKSLLLYNAPLFDTIRGTSTVVIGMIPSGLFLLTSMALAVGVIKLAKHHTLVQDLYSLEMLARVDTICFDKTGTITDGKMNVKDVVDLGYKSPYSINEIIGSMLLALKDNNQTAIALNNYFGQNDVLHPREILPFNSTRKLSAVTFDKCGTFTYGAPEYVLSRTSYSKIKSTIEQYAKLGYRVLLLAHSDEKIKDDKLPKDFDPVAIILIMDNIREDAIDTIKWFKQNGVAVKVISGDNPITVSEVSKRVGIENADKYISLEGMTENEIANIANEYTVFGRVTPEQKAVLVKAMKTAGHVTAMTGDGVNDILALKEADCAISVASGSEAARNMSNIVLMDNNFNSLPKVVYEGRRVINNIQSSASLYLMKTLFTMILSIIILSLNIYKTYPFQLPHLFMLEMFVIGIPSFFLSLQANDSRVEGHFISYVMSKSVPSALLMVVSVMLIELFKLVLGPTLPFGQSVYTTMQVFVMTYAGIISLFEICKPFNLYRGFLYGFNFASILIISIFLMVNGLTANGISVISPLWPLEKYWQNVLVIITIVLLDSYLLKLFSKLTNTIKTPKKRKHKTKQ